MCFCDYFTSIYSAGMAFLGKFSEPVRKLVLRIRAEEMPFRQREGALMVDPIAHVSHVHSPANLEARQIHIRTKGQVLALFLTVPLRGLH